MKYQDAYNRRLNKHCVDCGIPITNAATRCLICHLEKSFKQVTHSERIKFLERKIELIEDRLKILEKSIKGLAFPLKW